MTPKNINLCLGSDIGLRVLHTVPGDVVATVFSVSREIRREAAGLGFDVSEDNFNSSRQAKTDFAVSVHYPVIFDRATIERYERIYNIHPDYLPWGRGWYPVFWALFPGEPEGATLHEINEGLDTGPIVKQVSVPVRPEDDGRSLHQRVTEAEEELFGFLIGELSGGRVPPAEPQDRARGTYHSKDEFLLWKRNRPLAEISSDELLDLIRALSYRGYSGLEIDRGAQRFSVTMAAMDVGETVRMEDPIGRSKR